MPFIGTQDPDSTIPLGFPVLPKSGDEIHFKLIRAWLQDCDDNHYLCRRNPKSSTKPPTRVIDVRVDKGKDPGYVRLNLDPHKQGDYIALSHCWGKMAPEKRDKISLSKGNLHSREEGFAMKDLPQTFQDAIEVTRMLDKPYLWIDAICIIQKDKDDWERESKLMETVFENAYCTIAAVSTDDDSEEGFLRPIAQQPTTQQPCVKVHTSSHGPVYVCEDIDRFDDDVENSLLNQRAWVLQERALARRTIHFPAGQTYWECGGGIRCETLTRMNK